MSSTALFTAAELAEATGGTWLHGSPEGCFALNTDSRTVTPGECFVPLAGERFDGHDFLSGVAARGAACALCATGRPCPDDLPVLMVQDTLKAYQSSGRFHRQRMTGLKVLAITGSVGKTSVKEMLRAIFSHHAGDDAVLYTLGNTNNQIGVPQNLLRLTAHHRFAVIEMGTNHHGEIAPLTAAAAPNAALINSIAPCHLEFLGSLDGVAREKSTIFTGVEPGGAAICPAECAGHEILVRAARQAGLQISQFGGAGTDGCRVTGRILNDTLTGSTVELFFAESGRRLVFDWQLAGEFQAVNAAAAAAAALTFGLTPEEIVAGLRRTELPGKRMKVEQHDGVTWINDAYNANPASMSASLRHLRNAGGRERRYLLVLGDMRELGDETSARHREILALVRELFQDCDYQLFLLGDAFGAAREAGVCPDRWRHFASLAELREAVQRELPGEITVFLKSSNGLQLHTLEPFL